MSDPYFSNVQLLLHFDGVNGATTTVDSSSFARTLGTSGTNGTLNFINGAITTDNYEFGTSSAKGTVATGYLNPIQISAIGIPAFIPTGDFTLEFFVYGATGFSISFYEWDGGGGEKNTTLSGNGTNLQLTTSSATLGTSSSGLGSGWNYVVFQRSGSTTTVYLNSGVPVISTTTALIIGTSQDPGAGYYYSFTFNTATSLTTSPGYLDELRYTVGTARYSGSITTPTAAFPPPLVVALTPSTGVTTTPGTVGVAIGSATIASLASAGLTIATSPGAVGFAPSPVVTLSGFPIAVTPGTVGRGYSVATLSAIVSAAGTIPSIAVATAPLTGGGVTVAPGGVGATTPTNVSVPLTSGMGITVNSGTPVAVNLTALLVTISGALPPITGSIDIIASVTPYFAISGALPQISGNIYVFANTTTFVINGALPAFTSVWGYIHGSLPPFVAISESQAVFNGQVTYAMNIKTAETTQYANYNFLSIIRIGFNYYGVRSDGVYLLGGSQDITTAIPASFTTAQSSLGSTSIKHVPFLYMDAQNPATVTQITDNETAGPFTSHPTGLKTKLSRGIRGKIWQFKVSNINGNQFRIGALEALSETTSHRVK